MQQSNRVNISCFTIHNCFSAKFRGGAQWGTGLLSLLYCTLNTVHCKLITKHLTMYTCTIHTKQCTLYDTNRTRNTLHCTKTDPRHNTNFWLKCALLPLRCALYSVPCTVYNVQCALLPLQCALYSVHCTVYTAQHSCTRYIAEHLAEHLTSLCAVRWSVKQCFMAEVDYSAPTGEMISWGREGWRYWGCNRK